MKTILMSIHPQWCEKIFKGEKTIEICKTCPEPPFKVAVYCPKGSQYLALVSGGGTAQLFVCCNWKTAIPFGGEIGNGKVIGEFIVNEVGIIPPCTEHGGIHYPLLSRPELGELLTRACLTNDELYLYGVKKKDGCYGANSKVVPLSALHITAPKLYDKPKELYEFNKPLNCGKCRQNGFNDMNEICVDCSANSMVTRAPQSWQYIQDPTEEV